MIKFIAIIAITCITGILAKPMAEIKVGGIQIDTDHVDCKISAEVIDECGIQQGFSYRIHEFSYPANHTYLLSACKRQSDALKCLKAYAKCLPPLPKQILITMVGSRQRYNKKLCTEKPSEHAVKFLDLAQCIRNNKPLIEKGMEAELNAILTPEAIVSSKMESVQERLKHSCCAVAKARREYTEATIPNCKQHTHVATEIIDSYLAETVGIICPDFEGKHKKDCDKLRALPTAKSTHTRSFLGPILNVVQSLA